MSLFFFLNKADKFKEINITLSAASQLIVKPSLIFYFLKQKKNGNSWQYRLRIKKLNLHFKGYRFSLKFSFTLTQWDRRRTIQNSWHQKRETYSRKTRHCRCNSKHPIDKCELFILSHPPQMDLKKGHACFILNVNFINS